MRHIDQEAITTENRQEYSNPALLSAARQAADLASHSKSAKRSVHIVPTGIISNAGVGHLGSSTYRHHRKLLSVSCGPWSLKKDFHVNKASGCDLASASDRWIRIANVLLESSARHGRHPANQRNSTTSKDPCPDTGPSADDGAGSGNAARCS
jgi:hypothetical protein